MVCVLPNNKVSSLLSPQLLPLLASGGLQRWPPVAYSTREESAARPVGQYLVPNKKDMPYDIVDLTEEIGMKVTVNWKLVDLSDRDLAMLEFALAVCQADNITEEHFQKLERHGFDHEDAWDIGMISAFFAMSNCIAHYIDLRPNTEFYAVGRMSCGEKEKEEAECA